VHVDSVEAVRAERAVWTADDVVRVEHEMIDDELALAVEELVERLLPRGPVEDVLIRDGFPRKLLS
jgi:hypothetical protein